MDDPGGAPLGRDDEVFERAAAGILDHRLLVFVVDEEGRVQVRALVARGAELGFDPRIVRDRCRRFGGGRRGFRHRFRLGSFGRRSLRWRRPVDRRRRSTRSGSIQHRGEPRTLRQQRVGEPVHGLDRAAFTGALDLLGVRGLQLLPLRANPLVGLQPDALLRRLDVGIVDAGQLLDRAPEAQAISGRRREPPGDDDAPSPPLPVDRPHEGNPIRRLVRREREVLVEGEERLVVDSRRNEGELSGQRRLGEREVTEREREPPLLSAPALVSHADVYEAPRFLGVGIGLDVKPIGPRRARFGIVGERGVRPALERRPRVGPRAATGCAVRRRVGWTPPRGGRAGRSRFRFGNRGGAPWDRRPSPGVRTLPDG